MTKIRLEVKPLSVNEAWQGRRFKTPKYKQYEKLLLMVLPKNANIKQEIKIEFEFGFSNILSDIDNPLKMLIDILQKKYSFNDSRITELNVKKIITKKGEEFITIKFN